MFTYNKEVINVTYNCTCVTKHDRNNGTTLQDSFTDMLAPPDYSFTDMLAPSKLQLH